MMITMMVAQAMSDASLMGSAYNPLWLGDIVTDFHCNNLVVVGGINRINIALDQNLIEKIIASAAHVEFCFVR